MNTPEIADDGLPARSIYHQMPGPRPRRRTVRARLGSMVRNHAGMAACMAMLIASGALVVLSR